MLQIFSTICRKLIWESVRETMFFEFESFSFLLFYQKVSKFIKFRVFFKVLFLRNLGWIFFQLDFLGRTSVIDFHLFLLLFLRELHSWSEWRNLSGGLRFSCRYSSVPEFILRVQSVVLGAALSGITSSFSTPAKSSAAPDQLDFFFLRNKFLYMQLQLAFFKNRNYLRLNPINTLPNFVFREKK